MMIYCFRLPTAKDALKRWIMAHPRRDTSQYTHVYDFINTSLVSAPNFTWKWLFLPETIKKKKLYQKHPTEKWNESDVKICGSRKT